MDASKKWEPDLEEIFRSHENRIEMELHKMSNSFEMLAPAQDTKFMTNFFDYMNHRLIATCKKVEVEYYAKKVGEHGSSMPTNDNVTEENATEASAEASTEASTEKTSADEFNALNELNDETLLGIRSTEALKIIENYDSDDDNASEETLKDNNETLIGDGDLSLHTAVSSPIELISDNISVESKAHSDAENAQDEQPCAPKKRPNSQELDAAEHVKRQKSNLKNDLEEGEINETIWPKNTDPDVYLKNPSYRFKCMLCDNLETNLVNHYSECHGDFEMYVARPSPAMAYKLRRRSETFIYTPSTQQIAGVCYFCETTQRMSASDWKEHLQWHTGETEHSRASEFDHDADNDENDESSAITAFICELCNYVQMDKHGMEKHLMNEHEVNDPPLSAHFFNKITLIPDMTPLEFQSMNASMDKRLEFVDSADRYKCGIGWCDEHFMSYSDFKSHLWQSHGNDEKFGCTHCSEIIAPEPDDASFLSIVSNHVKLHGSNLFWCLYCELVFAQTMTIMAHIMCDHAHDEFKFRYEHRTNDCDIESIEEITVALQCNDCVAIFGDISKATSHFRKSHQSLNINFTARQLIKRTMACSTTEVSLDQESLNVEQLFDCLVCDEIQFSDTSLVKHFKNVHQSDAFVMKPGQVLPKYADDDADSDDIVPMESSMSQGILFYCFHCYDEDGQFSCFGSGQEVFAHWYSKHSNSKPFRFVPAEMAKCDYCDVIGIYQGLKIHQREMHPEQKFAMTSAFDADQCAICQYVGPDLGEHFAHAHEFIDKLNVFNPIPLNDEMLKELQQIQGQKKRRCGHCDQVFEIKDEYQQHHLKQHASMKPASEKFYDATSIQLIAGCCQSKLNSNNLIDHVQEHEFQSNCSVCSFHSFDLYEFAQHKFNEHGIGNDPQSLCVQMLQTMFWNTQVVFGNGLMLSKHNLVRTVYDDSKAFDAFVEQFVEKQQSNN